MIVNRQKPIIIEKTCYCWVDRQDIIKAILWWTDKPVARIKKIFMYGKYPAVSIYEEKIHIHRLLMSWKVKRKLGTKEYVHHKDGNSLNNHLWNFEIQNPREHQTLTNKGRKFTQQHKDKIGIANKKRKGMKYKIYSNPDLLTTKT